MTSLGWLVGCPAGMERGSRCASGCGRLLEVLGPEWRVDRCLFGTDGPYGAVDQDQLFDNGKIKRRLESLFPNEKDRQRLLGENFNELIS